MEGTGDQLESQEGQWSRSEPSLKAIAGSRGTPPKGIGGDVGERKRTPTTFLLVRPMTSSWIKVRLRRPWLALKKRSNSDGWWIN